MYLEAPKNYFFTTPPTQSPISLPEIYTENKTENIDFLSSNVIIDGFIQSNWIRMFRVFRIGADDKTFSMIRCGKQHKYIPASIHHMYKMVLSENMFAFHYRVWLVALLWDPHFHVRMNVQMSKQNKNYTRYIISDQSFEIYFDTLFVQFVHFFCYKDLITKLSYFDERKKWKIL